MFTTAADLTRRDAIAAFEILDDPPASDLEGLAELAAMVCNVSRAVVNIIDDRWQHQVAACGFVPGVSPIEDSMCAVVLPEQRLVVVHDASADERFAANPYVTGELDDVRFYASSPLLTGSGVAIGTLCVFDPEPGALQPAQTRALGVLAHQVVEVLELRRMTRELGRSNEELSHFAGQVGHDLGNPLTALIGQLELAADRLTDGDTARTSRALERAESAATRMQGMLVSLLDYARVGGADLRRSEVDLTTVLTACRLDLATPIGESGARVLVDVPVTVSGDATLLRMLLQNLIANAVKFSHADGGRPVVEIAAQETTTGWHITVDDNGPGVPEADRERVFALMERGDVADVPGLGLGLALCRRIAVAHGGWIGLDASPLGGARARVFLPR